MRTFVQKQMLKSHNLYLSYPLKTTLIDYGANFPVSAILVGKCISQGVLYSMTSSIPCLIYFLITRIVCHSHFEGINRVLVEKIYNHLTPLNPLSVLLSIRQIHLLGPKGPSALCRS